MRGRLFTGLALAAWVGAGPAACATGTKGSAAPPRASPSSPAPAFETQREPFMASCLKSVPSRDYCTCSFEQFQQVFEGMDLSRPLPRGDPHFAALEHNTVAICSSRLSEAELRGSFVGACVGTDQRKQPYCACVWASLRKSLSVADLIRAQLSEASFAADKTGIARACSGTLPGDAARADFVFRCEGGNASLAAYCDCVWRGLSSRYATEDIELSTFDLGSEPEVRRCKGAGEGPP